MAGKKARPSREDLDTGWSKEDERQCVLCQKYGDAKSSVSESHTKKNKAIIVKYVFLCFLRNPADM